MSCDVFNSVNGSISINHRMLDCPPPPPTHLVEIYCNACNTSLKQVSSVDLSNQPILADVVRCFELERPKVRTHFPKWDLAMVLSSLSSAPFEPLDYSRF